MSRKEGNWFGNSNIKGYLFFLLFTTIVAIFIKLANTYTSNIDFKIILEDVPDDVVVDAEMSNIITVRYEISGFKLVRNSFRESVLKTSYTALKGGTNGVYVLPADIIHSGIQDFLNISSKEISVSPEEVLYSVSRLASKEVPVRLVTDISYESGFGAINDIKITPENVKIIGALKDIDSIEQLFTQKIVLEDVATDVNETVSLDISSLAEGVVIAPTNIKIIQSVEKYTEGSVTVPVTLNSADKRNIQMFPKEITLFYAVPISKFDSVQKSDFTIEAITESKNSNETHLALVVTKAPSVVSETRLSLNQVQYVIVDE